MKDIIYQDKDLIVVNKKAPLLVYSEDKQQTTLLKELEKYFPDIVKVGKAPRFGLIHRLDKDTSGILLIARHNNALKFFQNQFKKREVLKIYIALVEGSIEKKGMVKTLIGRDENKRYFQKAYPLTWPKKQGKRIALTKWKRIRVFSNRYSLVLVLPKTGRKHQIRAHFKYLGYPIVGDKVYNFKNSESLNLSRHFLHCYFIKLKMPSGKKTFFKAPLPQELKETIKNLTKQYENKNH